MVNQAFRIKIAYWSEKEKEEKKIPGIGRYPMGPTNTNLSGTSCEGSALRFFLDVEFVGKDSSQLTVIPLSD